MLNEPVRGVIPEPSIRSLSGLEQLRAFLQGHRPRTPHAVLLGYRLTQGSSGTVVFNQPISPWFDVYDGFVDLTATAELVVWAAANTVAPPGVYVRTTNVSLRYLRPCTVENESVIARGRVLHAGSNITTVETLIEDALGRVVVHATGSTVFEVMDPPPSALGKPLEPVEEPTYPSPDPPRRPLSSDWTVRRSASPLSRFLGVEFGDISPGRATVTMPASEWFCNSYREVSPGILGALGSVVARGCMAMEIPDPSERFVTINLTYSFFAPVPPDGSRLEAVSTLRARRNELALLDVEIFDAEGQVVLIGQATGLVRNPTARPGQRTERLLLTVLFTDLVGSTEQAVRLGDARWGELLDQHHTLVRRALNVHKGREVKTTGDGFLATFDSPTRAVRCARDIRDGVERLGLKITAGIHTGECDLVAGDVGGVAVHTASRIESAAESGEILVSATVRDLIAGSGFILTDRGAMELKGLEEEWKLFAVE
jgi:uncharacterized protein (TIGR00369 family)